jgi:hypothetical protein
MNLWRSIVKRLDGWTTWGGSGVADEAEAFLQGRLLEQMRACGAGGQTPPWMWLNGVAHGDREILEGLAAPSADTVPAVSSWRAARAVVARELLDRSGGDLAAIRGLQQRALIPLEERFTDLDGMSPARLTDIVVHELRWATT